jgi:glycosyltransferase involved in cell wall biosynthesis
MPKISVCIPTYEMKGKGEEYLQHSFRMLYSQTFKDFDVVISDHSIENDIQNLCKNWKDRLDINYIRNDYKRGISSANINKAMKHATGESIKILFQDDFLYDEQSLEMQYVHFFSNHNQWMVSACAHTNDGTNIVDPFYPKYHDTIQYGNNTISSPSVLMIKNENVLEFDENLFWLMDVEYYKRLYDNFGLPSICNYITVVNRSHENQISNTIATKEIKEKEYSYIVEKYKTN